MISKSNIYGVWSGGLFLAFFGIGLWLLSGFIPPHLPSAGPEEIVAIYEESRLGIRTGMVIVMFAGSLFLPWTVMWSQLIKKMENGGSFLSQCQLTGGITASLFFTIPSLFWQVAAFRENNPPELIHIMNDAGWLYLTSPVPPFLIALIPLGIAILNDKNDVPLIPRWFGFATLWLALIFLPGIMVYFFKSGPFAWNGFLAFWIPVIGLSFWFPAAMVLAIKAIKTHASTANGSNS